MTRVTIDPTTMAKLHHLADKLEFCDERGRVLGVFTPASASREDRREPPHLSDEELRRRANEPGGRTIAEILADLAGQP